MNFFPIAATDMDMVIGIIAVATWILAQIFGRKKSDTPPDSPSQAPGLPTDPQDELRKFFEDMARGGSPEPRPAAPHPPLPPPRTHVHVKREKAWIRVPEPSPAQDVPVLTAREAAPAFMDPGIPIPATVPVVTSTLPPRPPVIEGIQDPLALRKMIITMEVLGKPVALRQTATP